MFDTELRFVYPTRCGSGLVQFCTHVTTKAQSGWLLWCAASTNKNVKSGLMGLVSAVVSGLSGARQPEPQREKGPCPTHDPQGIDQQNCRSHRQGQGPVVRLCSRMLVLWRSMAGTADAGLQSAIRSSASQCQPPVRG